MTLKIATYNIHHGLKLEKIIENIQKLSKDGVDIFCLQEMRESIKGVPVLKACLKALGRGWEYETFLEPGNYNYGLCLIWKSNVLEIKKTEKITLPGLPDFDLYKKIIEQTVVGRVRKLIKRGALIGTFKINGNLIRITNIHLDCVGSLAQRAKQVKHLTMYLKSSPGIQKEIICGDFNTRGLEVFSMKQEKKILDIFGPNFINANPKRTPTFHYLQRMDYIFVKNIKVNKSEVLKLKGSDHFPLIANLEI